MNNSKPDKSMPAMNGTENPFAKKAKAVEKKTQANDEISMIDAEQGYQKRFEKVESLKAMTDTAAWRSLVASLKRSRQQASERLLVVEKTRDLIDCQQKIRVIDSIFIHTKQPIIELNDYIKDMPLFKKSFPKKGIMTDAMTVEIVDN